MAEVSNNEVSLYLQRNLAAKSLFSILLLYGDDCKYTYYPYYALLWHTAHLLLKPSVCKWLSIRSKFVEKFKERGARVNSGAAIRASLDF